MVLFGTKSTHLISAKAQERYCACCDNYNTIMLNVFRIQFHLFGIPILPLSKTGNAYCQKCKKVLEEEAMPELIKQQYLLKKNEVKGPSWQISGSLLLLSLTLAFSLAHKKTNQKELEYLAYPNEGDVYEYKTDNSEFSTMKIKKVTADSIFVYLNHHNVDHSDRLQWINKNENYNKETVALERQKINDLYNTGRILEIYRIEK